MKSTYKTATIDTFDDFVLFWNKAKNKSLDDKIELWVSEYMSDRSELLEKQIKNYADQNTDWKQIAKEKVFPFLGDRLPAMKLARKNLLELCPIIWQKARNKFELDFGVTFVIYVGIGCGAGWATIFRDKPAVLFGLENIAECGWAKAKTIEGLIAHEIGHLAHQYWRKQAGLDNDSSPWWQLYSEGLAQRFEHIVLGRDSWHESIGINENNWLDWCKENKKWLAREFLKTADNSRSIRPFFGHWFNLKDHKQCGYFLGHEIIKDLQKKMDIKQVVLLNNYEHTLRLLLESYTNEETL